jgi:hypothetical protein
MDGGWGGGTRTFTFCCGMWSQGGAAAEGRFQGVRKLFALCLLACT